MENKFPRIFCSVQTAYRALINFHSSKRRKKPLYVFISHQETSILFCILYFFFLHWFLSLQHQQIDLVFAIGKHPLDDFSLISFFDNGADGLPAMESSSESPSLPSSVESLATFRAQIAAENEAEIYQRIRLLEGQHYYNIPPQNNQGDYERLVREGFNQAINVTHFREIYDREYLELSVLERKGLIQENLFNLLIGETQISKIMELSPYTDIRKEAYDFLNDQVSPVSAMRFPFQRDLMDGSLTSYLHDLSGHGRNSGIYREFYSHFTDESFRRANGLALPPRE